QAEAACMILLLHRQAGGDDRDEDEVVDAQDDLEGRQGEQTCPGLRICQQFEHEGPTLYPRRGRRRASFKQSLASWKAVNGFPYGSPRPPASQLRGGPSAVLARSG